MKLHRTKRVAMLLLALEVASRHIQAAEHEPWEAPPLDRAVPTASEMVHDRSGAVQFETNPQIIDLTESTIKGKPFVLPFSAGLGVTGGDSLSVTRTQIGTSMPVHVQMGANPTEPELVLMASVNFGANFLDGETRLDLPSELYRAGGGVNAIKRITDRWKAIGGVNINYQGDGQATSDVVNLSGVAMAQWQKSDQVQWMFGVAVTGIDDLPVLPIVGVSWKPNEDWEVSLGVPQTRIAHRVRWFGPLHETWLYTGLLGAGGGTFAVERPSGIDDRLTISEFPLALGLERRGDHAKCFLEVGVVAGRELEYEVSGEKEALREGYFSRAGLRY